jgi:hypothetical protein
MVDKVGLLHAMQKLTSKQTVFAFQYVVVFNRRTLTGGQHSPDTTSVCLPQTTKAIQQQRDRRRTATHMPPNPAS